MPKSSNYPTTSLDKIEPAAVQQIVTSLKDLYDLGKPVSDKEVEERIDKYFEFCETSSLRPGIESLCLALHVSRTTLFKWNKGQGCSERRTEIIQAAKSLIAAFLEQASLSGKLNPATSIFLMKNWLNYKDAYSFEQQAAEQADDRQGITKTMEQIAQEMGVGLPLDGQRSTAPPIEF